MAGLSLSLIEPVRTAVLFPYYLASGSTYHEATKNFQALDVGECALMYSNGIAVLDESQRGSQLRFDESARPVASRRIKSLYEDQQCVIAIVQEVNSNVRLPVGMEEIVDHRDRSSWTPKLKALRLLNSPKGYSFSVYKKTFQRDEL